MENEVIQKKPKSILNKWLLHIVLALLPFCFYAQEKASKEKTWISEKDYLEYQKKNKYEGPDDWYGSYSSDLESGDEYLNNTSTSSQRQLQYSPNQLDQDRRKRNIGYERGGGTVDFDPKVERPDPIELPDIDTPDIDMPDIDLPDVDLPSISPGFWKMLLFILVFVAIFVIVYLIIKNKKPTDQKIIVDVEDDWNPEVVSKTQLELRLEEAQAKEDYRECIRIYFMFILKELIRKSWINWKKQKTNHHYVIEMSGRKEAIGFIQCVRIYDLVWYGDYNINKEVYELLAPDLEVYYHSLDPINE